MAWKGSTVRRLLSDADERRVVTAIRDAESKTSGEIRVHVERWSREPALVTAQRWFERLGMRRTHHRNGVLFYVAVDERAFAVVGDEGIHREVGAEFWEAMRDAMASSFAQGDFAGGLVKAIEAAGVRLAEHFPRRPEDRNELPDDVSTR